MKQRCLFGDICPFDDCEECSDYSPIDENGEPDVDMRNHKRMALKDWVQLMEAVYCDGI